MLIFSPTKENIFGIMPSTTCMICQQSGKMYYYNVLTDRVNHTVKDDFLELFGPEVEHHLSQTDFICTVCNAVVRNVAKFKQLLWSFINNNHRGKQEEINPPKLSEIWDVFASLKFDEENDDDPDNTCRTPTPSKLLALNYSKTYNDALEKQIASVERYRSLSRASSGYFRSDASETSEVARLNSRRKRRKRNGHKNWTRPKSHGKSPASSEFRSRSTSRHSVRSEIDRNFSPFSDCSYTSSYRRRKSPVKKVTVYDAEGRLVRKRTRSVSRAQEEEARQLEILDSSKYYCAEAECPLYFEDVDILTHHKIIHHHQLALHFCDECQQRYTTLKHLKLHMKVHDKYSFLCPLCTCYIENQEELQEHLGQHLTYSVPCKYCDKSFLDKKACEVHYKSQHSDHREHVTHKKKIIIHRFDKDPESTPDSATNNSSDKRGGDNDNYCVYISMYTDMAFSEDDLDVTEENFKARGMDFIVQGEDDSHLAELVPKSLSQNEVESSDDSDAISEVNSGSIPEDKISVVEEKVSNIES